MSSSPYPLSPSVSDKQLKWVADLEKRYGVVCTDYTYAGVCNFIEKYTREERKNRSNGKNKQR